MDTGLVKEEGSRLRDLAPLVRTRIAQPRALLFFTILTLYPFSQHAGNEQVLQAEAHLAGVHVGRHLRQPHAQSRGRHVGPAAAVVGRVLDVALPPVGPPLPVHRVAPPDGGRDYRPRIPWGACAYDVRPWGRGGRGGWRRRFVPQKQKKQAWTCEFYSMFKLPNAGVGERGQKIRKFGGRHMCNMLPYRIGTLHNAVWR